MPSKMVALKELMFSHSNLMYENGIQPSNTEYSRKQKQLQKNYNILQYIVSAFDKKKIEFWIYIYIHIWLRYLP